MMESPVLLEWKALIGRLLITVIFIISGASKIFGFAGMVGYAASAGMPFPELAIILAIIFELGGGILLALGLKTKLAAKALIVFTVVATAYFHMNLADQMQMVLFLKNLAIIGGLFVVIAHGPGKYSLDAKNAVLTA